MKALNDLFTKSRRLSSIQSLLLLSTIMVLASLIWFQFDEPISQEILKSSAWGRVYEKIGFAYISSEGQSGFYSARTGSELSDKVIELVTRSNSHLFINLAKNRGRIELGENTAIKIEVVRKGKHPDFNVTLLKGDVFLGVVGKDKGVVSASWRGEPVFILEDGDIQISVANEGLQFNMHRGAAKIRNKNERLRKYMNATVTLDKAVFEEEDLVVLTPFPNERVFQTQSEPKKVRFAWSGLPPLTEVQLFAGQSKENMKSVWRNPVKEGVGEGFAIFGLGQYYWKLKATGTEIDLESPLYRLYVINEVSPRLITPVLRMPIFVGEGEWNFDFKWQNPSRLESLTLEISKDTKFDSIVVKEPVSDIGFKRLNIDLDEGEYFWRMSGFRHDSSELLFSPKHSFRVVDESNEEFRLESFPKDGIRISRKDLSNKEHYFVWKDSIGYEKSRIQIDSKNQKQILEVRRGEDRMLIPELALGEHEWVLEVSRNGEDWRALTPKKKVVVVDIPELEWVNVTRSQLRWKASSSRVNMYSVVVKPFTIDMKGIEDAQVTSFQTKSNFLNLKEFSTETVGVKVFAYDEKGNLISQSEERLISR